MYKAPKFDRQDVVIVSDDCRYDGFFKIRQLRIRHALFDGGESETFERELCERRDAVGILLYDPVLKHFALVEQVRVGALGRDTSPWMLEIVAGMIDKADEAGEDVAIRETREEAGLEVTAIRPMLSYYPTPGGSCEFFSLFIGRVSLAGVKEATFGLPEENEDIRLHILPVSHAMDLLNKHKISNGMTLIALQWFALNQAAIDAQWSP